ncbi:MAG: O-acetyl-ADP-ribose deacetylase [Pseudomonadota bacterium]|nr:MAG: O-acetyl-ADP-ribose deacetylase [Pseudomonadota bacterium]
MIRVVQGDITQLKVDAIVNAANSTLLGGGGVDGAIHRAAGPELKAHCATLGGCPTGEARITPGFKLPAKYVIHTVGPVYHGGKSNEATLLANCYRNSLELALQNGAKSIAFPSISTGAYGYPKDEAARIAVSTMKQYENKIDEIVACCFSAGDKALYETTLARS